MALTDVACRNAKPAERLRKLSDGGGLQLWVQPGGSRQWRYSYRYAGKQKVLAIGPYPIVTLAAARAARDEAKRQLFEGLDPAEVRRREKQERLAAITTFEMVAEEYLQKLRAEGRAPATMNKVEWLLSFAYPRLGSRPIDSIRPADVLSVLRKVEARGRYESARRLRSTIGAVCRYAVATARAENDPTIALQGALTTPKATPRPAITDEAGLGGLLNAIDAFDGQATTRIALQLLALLFPRPGELRASEWREFDLEECVWSIPSTRTKMRRDHRIPLAPQSVARLKELSNLTGDGRLLLPSLRATDRPISDNTFNAALRRMGYGKEEVTAHGFRATASTLLNESGKWHPDAIERQLAHVESNEVRRAYARGEHWEERVRMMVWWADYLDRLKFDRSKKKRGEGRISETAQGSPTQPTS